ncbi:MAG TPA: hypothetical protein VGI64_23495 [Streptosporangiaceae bacterium]
MGARWQRLAGRVKVTSTDALIEQNNCGMNYLAAGRVAEATY